MRLYVYVVTHDTGFAPNPFHGYCTLATCKPVIRRGADIGDWVVGVGSTQNGQEGQLVYAMRVEEAMSFDEYWTDPRFQLKKPDPTGDQEFRCGDNIYHRDPATGDWTQAPGYHSFDNGCQDPHHVERDTKSPRVLISQQFVYYGNSAIDIPHHIRFFDNPNRFIGFPGHLCNFPAALERYIVEWLQDLCKTPGIHDTPTHWTPSKSRSC